MTLLGAPEQARASALMLSLLTDRADVYAADAVTGAFTVLVASGLRCELVRASQAASPPRIELEGRRRLIYDPAFDMGDHYRLVIGGVRWNVVAGTIRPERATGGDGTAVLNGCDVIGAEP